MYRANMMDGLTVKRSGAALLAFFLMFSGIMALVSIPEDASALQHTMLTLSPWHDEGVVANASDGFSFEGYWHRAWRVEHSKEIANPTHYSCPQMNMAFLIDRYTTFEDNECDNGQSWGAVETFYSNCKYMTWDFPFCTYIDTEWWQPDTCDFNGVPCTEAVAGEKVLHLADKYNPENDAGYTTPIGNATIKEYDYTYLGHEPFPSVELHYPLLRIPTPKLSLILSDRIELAWTGLNDPFGDMIAGYRVYRSTANETGHKDNWTDSTGEGNPTDVDTAWTVVGNTTTDSFVDNTIASGTVYYYKISVLYTGTQWVCTSTSASGVCTQTTLVDDYGTLVESMYKSSGSDSTSPRDTLFVGFSSLLPASIGLDQADIPVAKLHLTSNNIADGSVLVGSLKPTLGGNLSTDDIASIKLYDDLNSNGAVDSGEPLLSTSTFDALTRDASLGGFELNITPTAPKDLLITISTGNTLSQYGNDFWLEIAGSASYGLKSFDRVAWSAFPLKIGPSKISSDTLRVAFYDLMPETVTSGTAGLLAFQLRLECNAEGNGEITVSSINLALTGTAAPSGVSKVSLFVDTDGDGIHEDADGAVVEATLGTGGAAFTGLSIPVENGEITTVSVLIDLIDVIPNGQTIGVHVAANTNFELSTIDVISPDGLPDNTRNTTVLLDTDLDGIPDDANWDTINDPGDDLDDDNDGILDVFEEEAQTDSRDPTSTPLDTDGDGIPDIVDADDDGNGILDIDEKYYIGGFWLPYLLGIIGAIFIVLLLALVMARRKPKKSEEPKEDAPNDEGGENEDTSKEGNGDMSEGDDAPETEDAGGQDEEMPPVPEEVPPVPENQTPEPGDAPKPDENAS